MGALLYTQDKPCIVCVIVSLGYKSIVISAVVSSHPAVINFATTWS